MDLKNVWEICELNDDIKYGRFHASSFAVELYSVLSGSADDVYIRPERFLSNTYPTENMKFVLKEALKRLSSNGGQPVFVLDTEFGGGKTHTLLLLYHVFKDKEVGTRFIKDLGLDREVGVLEVPEARVVAVDCRQIRRNTLWGEVADALGHYAEFEAEDRAKQPVNNIAKIKGLLEGPTLILLDELPDYLLRASADKVGEATLADLTISFIINLISAVSSSKNSMLVVSLTGKQNLYERYVKEFREKVRDRGQKPLDEVLIEELNQKTREAFSRQAQVIVPVEKKEVAKVINKRLFRKINENEAEKVVDAYYEYYNDKGLVVNPDYRGLLQECYPFHPTLIDALYDRVSTIEEFNKTRGMLRLLAMVLYRIYMDKTPCTMVSAGDIPLDDRDIKDELTSKLGKGDLRPVIETDIIEKARTIDSKRRVKLAERVARTIYLYSLIGSSKPSGIKMSELKLAVCQPGVDPALVDEVVKQIDEEFWYLQSDSGSYHFVKEPNINRIIFDYIRDVTENEVRERIRKTLEKLLPPHDIKPVVWNRQEIEDSDNLKVFAVDYKDILNTSNIEDLLQDILEKTHDGKIRSYRNSLIMVVPEKAAITDLIDKAKRVLAIEKAKKDDRIRLDKDRLKKIDARLAEAEGNLDSTCLNVYSKVAYPRIGDGRLQVDDILARREDLTEAVLSFLKEKGKLVENLSPQAIADDMLKGDKKKIGLKEVYELYRTDRRLPFILKGTVILKAVENGVRDGLFGYAEKLEERDGKYVAKIKQEVEVDWDGWIINKDYIIEEKIVEGTVSPVKVEEKEVGETPQTVFVPPTYSYSLSYGDIDGLLKDIDKIKILKMDKDVEANLSLDLQNRSGDKVKVESSLQSPSEIKELLGTLKNRGFNGQGTLTLNSKKELKNELEKYGLKV